MLITCWSVKGGSGTTVVAASLAVLAARAADVLVVDLAGDIPAALGLPDPSGPGLGEWLDASEEVGLDALRRLEVPVMPSLALLHRGSVSSSRRELAPALASDSRTVVVDAGVVVAGAVSTVALELAASATTSLLVIRPCYLALRRAVAAPLRPSAVVLVSEPLRSLGRSDIEDVLGVPVIAEIPWDPGIARSVDAGLLASRLPSPLVRPLGRVA